MWSINELKSRAIAVLKMSYWKAFLVSLVLAIAGGYGGSSFNLNWKVDNSDFTAPWSSITIPDFSPVLIAVIIAASGF